MKKIGILVLGLFCFALVGCGSDKEIEECKEIVVDRLKAPSTAVFTKIEKKDKSDLSGIGDIIIKGSVDSQNGYGAMGRSDFVCVYIDDSMVAIFEDDEYSAIYDTVSSKF